MTQTKAVWIAVIAIAVALPFGVAFPALQANVAPGTNPVPTGRPSHSNAVPAPHAADDLAATLWAEGAGAALADHMSFARFQEIIAAAPSAPGDLLTDDACTTDLSDLLNPTSCEFTCETSGLSLSATLPLGIGFGVGVAYCLGNFAGAGNLVPSGANVCIAADPPAACGSTIVAIAGLGTCWAIGFGVEASCD